MDFHKIKGIIILLICVIFISGITYFVTVKTIMPQKEKSIIEKAEAKQKLTNVVVAKVHITVGTKITEGQVALKQVPQENIIDNTAKKINDVVGKTANTNIYTNEQIRIDGLLTDAKLTDSSKKDFLTEEEVKKEDQLDPSDRFITIDVPKYNFVNGRVKEGSQVDILVDMGQGRYEVVLAKTRIYDMKEIAASSDSGSSKNKDKVTPEIERPIPKPLKKDGNEVPGVTNSQLTLEGNPTLDASKDYRITIRATEKEHKNLLWATNFGKFMLREYLSENQPPSQMTFTSPYSNDVSGNGTALPDRKPKVNTTVPPNTTVNIPPTITSTGN